MRYKRSEMHLKGLWFWLLVNFWLAHNRYRRQESTSIRVEVLQWSSSSGGVLACVTEHRQEWAVRVGPPAPLPPSLLIDGGKTSHPEGRELPRSEMSQTLSYRYSALVAVVKYLYFNGRCRIFKTDTDFDIWGFKNLMVIYRPIFILNRNMWRLQWLNAAMEWLTTVLRFIWG